MGAGWRIVFVVRRAALWIKQIIHAITYREETAPKRDIFLTSPCTAVEGAGAASSVVVASMVLVWCGVLHFAASSLTRFWSTESWLCLERG